MEVVGLDSMANGVGMDPEFSSDGTDLPLFGVKVSANLSAGFWLDHSFLSAESWNPWERVNPLAAAAAKDAAQQPHSIRFGPQWPVCNGRGGLLNRLLGPTPR